MTEPALQGEGPEADPLARTGALAIAVGRVALGVTIIGFTRRALAGLGFAEPSPGALALARLAGGRDIAVGLQALSVAHDPQALKHATAIGAGVDVGDAIFFGLGLTGDPESRRMALRNAPLGAGAAIAGLLIHRRL